MKLADKNWLRFTTAALVFSMLGCSSVPGKKQYSAEDMAFIRKLEQYKDGYKVGKPYSISGESYYPEIDPSYDEEGVASWYGPGFHGRSTANGEQYDQFAMTAAHKTLPLPSVVKVTNLANGKSAIVRVNDRGPFVGGRIIDLSRTAAEEIGMMGSGTAKVRVQMLKDETLTEVARVNSGGQPANYASNRMTLRPMEEERDETAEDRLEVPPPAFADGKKPERKIEVADILPPAKENDFGDLMNGLEKDLGGKRKAARQDGVKKGSPIFIKISGFEMKESAEAAFNDIKRIAPSKMDAVDYGDRENYSVMVGPMERKQDAEYVLNEINSMGYADAEIVNYSCKNALC